VSTTHTNHELTRLPTNIVPPILTASTYADEGKRQKIVLITRVIRSGTHLPKHRQR
jgi:hypothetical protein